MTGFHVSMLGTDTEALLPSVTEWDLQELLLAQV